MINVYDFDKTIYHGDSSIHFWLYCMKQKPIICILLPIQLLNFILIKLHITDSKSLFFSFLHFFKDEKIVVDFWNKHQNNICEWYMKQCEPSDVIVSASPTFLIEEISKRLGVNCIASEVLFENGKCISKNCKGEQKVTRFKKRFPMAKIEKCYGDSKSDRFIMALAKEAYFVRNISSNEVEMSKI